MMICNYCKKEYEKESDTLTMFGSRFCLHDDKLKQFRLINGLGVRNDSLTANRVHDGRTNTEEKYIRDAEKDGDFVVRSSDGLLRRMSDKQELEIQ